MDFFNHLAIYLSQKEINNLKLHLQDKSKNAALLNPFLMSDEDFLSIYPNVIKHPIVEHAYIYDKEQYDLGKSIYHELGCFYLQDPSAMIPAYLLDVFDSDTILDLCAAPGGKSIQCSFKKHNHGIIISNDISKERCHKIIENINRLGIGNIIVTNNDFSKIKNNYLNFFDKIILDAPCSGSGMFRKDKAVEKDWTYNKVLKFQKIQKDLILSAYEMLKPGGILCYSTCSFSYEEDEEVASFLLQKTNAEVEIIKSNPYYYVDEKTHLGIHLFPHLFPGEGQYICLFKKPIDIGVSEVNKKNRNKKITDINHLFKLLPFDVDYNYIFDRNNVLYLLPKKFNFDNLFVLKAGVEIGKYNKEIEKYSYQFARYIHHYKNEISLTKQEAEQIINCASLAKKYDKGLYLLKYEKYPICFCKSDGRILKNWYYKPLYKKTY